MLSSAIELINVIKTVFLFFESILCNIKLVLKCDGFINEGIRYSVISTKVSFRFHCFSFIYLSSAILDELENKLVLLRNLFCNHSLWTSADPSLVLSM